MKMLLLDFKFSGVLIPYRELERKKKNHFWQFCSEIFTQEFPWFYLKKGSKTVHAYIYIYIYTLLTTCVRVKKSRLLMHQYHLTVMQSTLIDMYSFMHFFSREFIRFDSFSLVLLAGF